VASFWFLASLLRAAMRSASALSAASRACLPSSGFAGADCVEVSEGAVWARGVDGGDGAAAGSAGASGRREGVGSDWAAICLLAHQACPKPTGIVIGEKINPATTSPSRTETVRDASSMTGPRSQKLHKLDAMNQGIFWPPQVSFPASVSMSVIGWPRQSWPSSRRAQAEKSDWDEPD